MYDFTIGLFESIVKHGLSWSTAAAVLFLILKQRAMKRKLKRYLPFMFKDEEVNPTYVNNQKTIMENQRMMMERMGLEWSGPESPMKPIPTSLKKSYQLSWRAMKMKNKLKSRKFWITILGAALVVLNETFDLGLSPESQATIVAILISFILGESHVDAKRAGKEQTDAPNYTDSGAAE